MKSLIIIGFSVGTVLACCASSSGAQSEPTTGTAAAPAHQRDNDNEDGDQAGMMAGMCPMQVQGTAVAPVDVEGGIGLSFTTTTGDVMELRQRVSRMAEMHNQRSGHTMMGSHPAHAQDAGVAQQRGAHADAAPEVGPQGGTMMGGGMRMPAATASVEHLESGARLILQPKDPAQLGKLRERVHMKAKRMADGDCPMMSLSSVREPAPANSGTANHDAHHKDHRD